MPSQTIHKEFYKKGRKQEFGQRNRQGFSNITKKQSGFTIKNVRTDDDLEFKGKFYEKGFVHQVEHSYDHVRD